MKDEALKVFIREPSIELTLLMPAWFKDRDMWAKREDECRSQIVSVELYEAASIQ